MHIQQTKLSTIRKSLLALVPIFAALTLVVAVGGAYAAKPADKGFNDAGYNYNARVYNNFYPSYPDAHLVMKWSKDWTPQVDEPIGAWTTNHWTWYSNDYDESNWYGWNTMTAYRDGAYKIEEFLKIQRVSDDQVAWEMYEQGGAYSAGWGTHDNGVPKYVVLQDVITVYDEVSNQVVATYNLTTTGPKGLGQPIF